MPVKKTITLSKLLRAITPKRTPEWARAKWWTVRPVIAGSGIGVVVVAMVVVVAAYQSTPPSVQKKTDTAAARTAGSNGSMGTSSAANASARASASTQVAQTARVTITGCLERSDETFKLTDTSGTSSPTSRSWKSGFLKKRPAHIEVVDSVKRLNLASHVGERVSVTGTLVDREMHAGSVQRVSSSCSVPKVKI
jgi:hypothetical protein